MSTRPAGTSGRDVHGVQDTAPADGEVPAAVRAAALGAFSLRDRQAQVLDLFADSAVDDPTHAAPRRLWFLDVHGGADVSLRVRELAGSDLLALDVLTGSAVRVVGVQGDGGEAQPREISPGWWVTGPLRHGLLSVALESEGRRLRTAWVRL